ncbi:MAG: hypothetical protein AMJ65_02980 [Phycisphaerae bacterium SG8_4]|nr:MAG: hypothetical protein AMJ65_02980 [Phycisphaerae bacterium SG8_4]
MVSGKEPNGLFDDLLFPKIFRTFRVAIQPTKLIIAFLGVAVICLAGWFMDLGRTVVVGTYGPDEVTELGIYMNSLDEPGAAIQAHIDKYGDTGERAGVFSTLWHFGSAKFHTALRELFEFNFTSVGENLRDCFRAVTWAFRYHYAYCLVFVTIALAVISVAGGALCRIAALQFAQGEKPGLTEAVRFSVKRFSSLFTAPLAPIGIMLFMGLFIFVLGLAGNIPHVGELIVVLGTPLALINGALIAVILIGAVAGFGLMFPAVAYDGSDCFDSISRSFSYVYAQPSRMACYTVIAAVYGAVCYVFVRFYAFLMLSITYCLLQLGIWTDSSTTGVDKLSAIWPRPEFMNFLASSDQAPTTMPERFAAWLVWLFVLMVVGLIVSFIISFYFSANTIIYSLMRNRVDKTALNDVCTHFDETEIETSTAQLQPGQDQ